MTKITFAQVAYEQAMDEHFEAQFAVAEQEFEQACFYISYDPEWDEDWEEYEGEVSRATIMWLAKCCEHYGEADFYEKYDPYHEFSDVYKDVYGFRPRKADGSVIWWG